MEIENNASNSSLLSPSAYRHYCCVCSNYRGKVIDGVAVKLHRFPADKTLQNIWLKRIRLISPNFQVNIKNDRLCSAHFQHGSYIKSSKHANIPSIFILRDGKEKRFCATMDQSTAIINERQQVEDQSHECLEPQSMEVDEEPEPLYTHDLSNEQTSALLHDYCGFVQRPVITHLDKCEQTLHICKCRSRNSNMW